MEGLFLGSVASDADDAARSYSEVVEVAVELPGGFFLDPVYPNPFNPQASVSFMVASTQHVSVSLFDAAGREQKVLFNGIADAKARTEVRIEAGNLPSGIYLVRVMGEDFARRRFFV